LKKSAYASSVSCRDVYPRQNGTPPLVRILRVRAREEGARKVCGGLNGAEDSRTRSLGAGLGLEVGGGCSSRAGAGAEEVRSSGEEVEEDS
jgi:hypothetical protein